MKKITDNSNREKFKCPTCPKETVPKDTKIIYFWWWLIKFTTYMKNILVKYFFWDTMLCKLIGWDDSCMRENNWK